MTTAAHTSHVIAGLLGGEVHVAQDQDTHEVLAVAVWLPPGKTLYDTYVLRSTARTPPFTAPIDCSDEIRDKALLPLINATPPDVDAWFKRMAHINEESKRRALGDLQKTDWWLQRIGVKPGFHGRGLGKALIDAVRIKVLSAAPRHQRPTADRPQAHGLSISLGTKSMLNVRRRA